MDIKKLMPGLAVSQQIAASDLQAIKAAGFRAIVCNRPDGEGSDRPNFSEIEAAAREQGIEAHYLPVESGKVGDAEAALFGELMQALPKPVLAYCRTGMRACLSRTRCARAQPCGAS
jgi:sulfide:quinone oxidoreductase